jgi:hypothetical protein
MGEKGAVAGGSRRVVRERERKGASPTTLERQSRRRRVRGARGMMNIKAGQAVRVDSTLSVRELNGPRRSSDQYFLREKPRRQRR